MTRLAARVEHRSWGLDSAIEERQWLLEISCATRDPTLWDVLGHAISAANRLALEICATCPHGGLGREGRCEEVARKPNLSSGAYRTDGVIMAGALWREGVPFIPSRCVRCKRPYLWRWQAGGAPDHRCPASATKPPQPWNVLAA